ncbi:MAG: hypothetical protein ACXV97_02520 [Chthoniobacterales bacterium]
MLLVCSCAASAAAPPATAASIIAALEKLGFKATAVSPNVRRETFFAQFSEAGELLNDEIGPRSNYEILYLLPDQTYLFAESRDILPRTIFEKGMWEWSSSLLTLTSDESVPRNKRQRATRHLIPLFLRSRDSRKLIFIDSDEGLECLTSKPPFDTSQLARRIVAYNCVYYRKRKLSSRAGHRLKAELMRDSWNPEWYQDATGK